LNSLLTSHASLALRADITSVAFRARGASNTGNALDSLRASLTGWPRLAPLAGVALRSGNAGDALRSSHASHAIDARWTRRTNAARDTGDTLRSYIATVALCASHAGRTGDTSNAGDALRSSHASHALRSLRTSKANLRPRCKITGKLPELAVTQRQNQHPGFTPQLRYCVTLGDVGNAAVSALAVPCLVRSVGICRVERHDRSEYVGAFDA
jgi:hypothetical protein